MDTDELQDFKISEDSRELIVSFLVRFCLSLNDEKSAYLFTFASDILKEFFTIWPTVSVNLTQLCKVATMDLTDSNMSYVLNSAEILKLTAQSKSAIWAVENLGSIQICLEKWMSSDNSRLEKSFAGLLGRVCEALNSAETQSFGVLERQGFLKLMDSRLRDRLKSVTSFSSVGAVLKAVYFDRIKSPGITSLLREHLADLVGLLGSLVADSSSLVTKAEGIETVLRILNHQISSLGESRKTMIGIMLQIVEQPQANQLHRVLLDILRKWTLEVQTEAFPTLKEKCGLACRMIAFQEYSDATLFDEYMSLVADIYEVESLNRTELTVRLEPVFLAGTRMKNQFIRNRFAYILDKSLPEKVSTRLAYILGNFANKEVKIGKVWRAIFG